MTDIYYLNVFDGQECGPSVRWFRSKVPHEMQSGVCRSRSCLFRAGEYTLIAGLSFSLAIGWSSQFLTTRASPQWFSSQGSQCLPEKVMQEKKEPGNRCPFYCLASLSSFVTCGFLSCLSAICHSVQPTLKKRRKCSTISRKYQRICGHILNYTYPITPEPGLKVIEEDGVMVAPQVGGQKGWNDLSQIRLTEYNNAFLLSYNIPWCHVQMKVAQPTLFKLNRLGP